MTTEDIVARLDKLSGILQLAHYDAIEASRTRIRADKTNTAILDQAGETTPAGKLIKAVKQKTGQSQSTIKRRIAALVELGVLEKSGGGPITSYRTTGLV